MIPFRIIKADDEEGYPMLNFRKVFKMKEPEPAVLAIVVPRETEAGTARIQAAGFSTEFKQEIDGAVAYLQQEDVELGQSDQVIVKFDEGLSAVVRLKSFEPYSESTSFTENLKKNGFIPGFDMALTVLRETVFNALFEAESPDTAQNTIDTAVKEFRAHVADMAAALPETAFKLDPAVVLNAEKAEVALKEAVLKGVAEFNVQINIGPETSVGAPAVGRVDPSQREGNDEVAARPVVGKEDEATETKTDAETEVVETEVAAKDGQDGEVSEEKVSDEKDSTIEALKQLLSQGLTDITTKVEAVASEVREQVGQLSARVDAAEATARKAAEDVNGTVSAGSQEDPENATARKSNGYAEPPLMDTGWDRLQTQ